MNLLGESPVLEILEPLERIFRQSLVRGAPRPYGVVVEDPRGSWKTTLASLSLDSRRAAVVVARGSAALDLSARWSVGGALLLPPSTATMTAALVAARGALGTRLWVTDPVVLRDLGGQPGMRRVTAVPSGAWSAMVGRRGTVECLVALADQLGCAAFIDQGPSLLIADTTEEEIRRAWTAVANRPIWAGAEALAIASGSGKTHQEGEPKRVSGSWPVAELPSGRTVARWTFGSDSSESIEGRSLLYEVGSGWTLGRGDGERDPVPEISDPDQLAVRDVGLVRIPGWLSLDLEREGAPGAVLVKAMSREAARRGFVLWVPGVNAKDMPFILRLEGRIWVDGPAIPGP